MRNIIIRLIVVFVLASISFMIGFCSMRENSIKDKYDEYFCDVKNFEFATTIEISKGNEKIAKVAGNVFTFATDPLTMYDLGGNKLSYAGDAYHFIAQDSHSIYVKNKYVMEMVGKVDALGETYDIYNFDKEKVAHAEFNESNTYGSIYDSDNKLIAEYTSNYVHNDFKVRISEHAKYDHKAILMIFCSYYSDQEADS